MKRILALLVVTSLAFVSCEGDQGPPGEDGLDGAIGTTYDFFVDFNESNGYSHTLLFADKGIEVFESDGVLVYRSSEYYEDPEGEIDIWKPLSQRVYFTNGDILEYDFEHTFGEVNIFLGGNIEDFGTLSDEYTQNQLFRIIVAPSDFINNANVNLNDYNSVVKELQSYKLNRQ
ncbi:hypothetical protein [Sinomicrobium weinanense]|uniref:Collagen-like protein n=1 Tax=Sinomicrobium weinanense TaxID=2842200 RepID=A0A926Q2I7_9FLAO|nr:hypothetical protein [Sinomicrobium weinanense]MBC9796568.1 hypothetical protein [Sinomicrobium weinanense]MBU3123045.1 hypothetical protein [Sinomicrobium weinanense]